MLKKALMGWWATCVFTALAINTASAATRPDIGVYASGAPAAPSNPAPSPGAASISTSPTLMWTSWGATSYDVYFGTSYPPSQVTVEQTAASYAAGTLTANTTYFWQVVAFNAGGATVGPVWSFTTSRPGAPSDPAPSIDATTISTSPTLTWTSSGATSYDVYFGATYPPPQVTVSQDAASYAAGTLTAYTTYFWQVVAFNGSGATVGPVWWFTTGAPGTPSNPTPSDAATNASTSPTLAWTSSGATSYDVYFGMNNPPPQVTVSQTAAWYAAGTLTANTTYFWQIVAFNGSGATVGPVWSFTADAPPPPHVTWTVSPAPSPSVTSSGVLWTVNAGDNLQAALNNAQPGDTILLQAGATFSGNFTLPVKGGASYITIRSSTPDAFLPGPGTRIDPSYEPLLAKIQSPNSGSALATVAGAHHFRLLLLEFPANYQGDGDVIELGDGSSAQNALVQVPHDFVVDRVYIHGDVTNGQKRAIGLNSASTTIVNSYIAEIKANGQDSQAICGWNGPGPFLISNNYLEAAGENVLFGGADPSIPNLVPSDITFTHNYVTKQTLWMTQPQWNVKNLLELKNVQRMLADGNVMEYNWVAAQPGYSVLFTPRNQDGTAPWSVVQEVQFSNNVVRHVSSGINILGVDDVNPSQPTHNLVIENNLFEDISAASYGGAGRFVLIDGGSAITIDHNTVFEDGTSALYAYTSPVQNFVFTNNIVPDNSWAIMGGNASPGNGTIQIYFPASTFLGGIYAGSNPATYPAGNYYPVTMSAVGFVNLGSGNYRLSSTSTYLTAATDGTAVGCNIDALNRAAGTHY